VKKALEPYMKLAPFVGIGLIVVAIAIVWIFYIQRGAHVELTGSILKVRTLALDEQSSAIILDFRVLNPSDYPFIVRKTSVYLTDPGGQTIEGEPISDVDANRLFQYFPMLGQKFNESLVDRTRISAHQSMDRMLAVRFDLPEALLKSRKGLRLRIEELDGPVSELSERAQ
jgi:hypothetical protein